MGLDFDYEISKIYDNAIHGLNSVVLEMHLTAMSERINGLNELKGLDSEYYRLVKEIRYVLENLLSYCETDSEETYYIRLGFVKVLECNIDELKELYGVKWP
jgi:hypothetical protein